jgi:hypothetical protein
MNEQKIESYGVELNDEVLDAVIGGNAACCCCTPAGCFTADEASCAALGGSCTKAGGC